MRRRHGPKAKKGKWRAAEEAVARISLHKRCNSLCRNNLRAIALRIAQAENRKEFLAPLRSPVRADLRFSRGVGRNCIASSRELQTRPTLLAGAGQRRFRGRPGQQLIGSLHQCGSPVAVPQVHILPHGPQRAVAMWASDQLIGALGLNVEAASAGRAILGDSSRHGLLPCSLEDSRWHDLAMRTGVMRMPCQETVRQI